MKKNNELRVRIIANWIKITITWGISTAICFAIMNTFTYKSDAQAIGFLMMSPIFGLLVISPLACMWDKRISKYTRILNNRKEKGLK